MLQHLDMNKLYYKNPFGFQKQKSSLNRKIAQTYKIYLYNDEMDTVLTIVFDSTKVLTSLFLDVFNQKIKKNKVLEKTQDFYWFRFWSTVNNVIEIE